MPTAKQAFWTILLSVVAIAIVFRVSIIRKPVTGLN